MNNDVKRVLVTGANGFVGRALCQRLLERGWLVRAAMRQGSPPDFHKNLSDVTITDIDAHTDWAHAVEEVDVVVHLAARVHVMSDTSEDPLGDYRRVNVQGTRNLLEHSIRAGVKRFVYLSSVKVNGEEATSAYSEKSMPAPEDPYGVSKMEAEALLKTLAGDTGTEFVVIRPPLVYGPGVKANFLALLGLVRRKVPLPLAAVRNRRSMIYIGNLVDCIIMCMNHRAAAGQTYLVSDDRAVSTPDLIRLVAAAMQVPCYLLPFPPALLRAAGRLLGKREPMERLLGSLSVDITKIKNELGWMPPYSMESGLKRTAKWYKKT